ncbi:MAG: M28 family peptidase [Cyanobacteria bacterium SZAS LIN-2]|nr:M28 family peptidase [Cyanobacteria bacterium SZAS LIN-2]
MRRTRNFRTPKIDTTNLPKPDPRIVGAFAGIDINRLKDVIQKLSGEVPITVAGQTTTLVTRNSFTKGLDVALGFIEEQYKAMGNGITVTRHAYKVRGKTFYNIIAERRGNTTPDKVVVFGAHLDSTAGSPWGSESNCPGADDDGSGTAALLELARNISALSLGHTVRFCHFTGEEQGLWGSYAYSDKLAKEGVDVVAMVELDMVGYCAKPGNRLDIHDGADKNGSHALTVMFTRNIKAYGINLNPVDTHNHAVDDRSDHAGFLDHGWKAVLLSEEFTDDGFNPNYHTTGDRLSAVNLPYMVEVVKAVVATACELAALK